MFCLALLLLGLAACARAGEVERTVVFRDGTILRLQIPDGPVNFTVLSPDGSASEATAKLSDIQIAKLALAPRLGEYARIRAWIGELGHDDHAVRERAAKALLELGRPAREDLKAALASASLDDLETALRLRRILAALPAGDAAPGEAFSDRIRLHRAAGTVRGEIREWSCQAKLDGAAIELDRARVESLWATPPAQNAAQSAASGVTRRGSDTDRFPPDATRIDFETGPSGERLDAGNDIGRTFIARGCTLSTSIEGAIVSVNNYDVGGRSHGNSCATHQPLWEGTLSVRFCLPGKEHVPAGVTCVGLWIAAVSADGTALEAYDAHGRKIGDVKTTRGPAEFLGLHSSTPIACVKIVPNAAIDPNYTIDDLIFDTPKPLGQAGNAALHAVSLASGERVFCRAVSVRDGVVAMEGLSVGPESLRRPLAEVASLTTPLDGWQAPAPRWPAGTPALPSAHCWLKLADGSLLRAVLEKKDKDKVGLLCPRLPKLEFSAIAAAWPDGCTLVNPPADAIFPKGGYLLMEREENNSLTTTSKAEPADLGKLFPGVKKEPVLWFQPAPKERPAAGLLELSNGERLVLDEDAFVLKSWTADGLVVQRGEQSVSLPPSEVMSVTLPKRK